MSSLFEFDCAYRCRYGVFAGIDEAGRGPVAGPLVASAVVLPESFDDPVLNDSKKLTDKKRRALFPLIQREAIAFGMGVVTSSEIDRLGMTGAVRLSFNRAAEKVTEHADFCLVDGNSVSSLAFPCRFLVKGDSKSLSIAAASILAKVTRDDMMIRAASEYPEYGFEKHKGYGTAAHLSALESNGPSPIHRMSFEPLRSRYETGQLSLFPMGKSRPGEAGEIRAVGHLEAHGYNVVHRNYRTPAGEIDIIAKKGNTVFFIEVKSSFSFDEDAALEKINSTKIRRIRTVAEAWIQSNCYKGDVNFLALTVTPDAVRQYDIKYDQ